MRKIIKVVKAVYLDGYKVLVSFSDGIEKEIDVLPFLQKTSHPVLKQYLDEEKFKSFKIEGDNIVWGENWDLIFPVSRLYRGKI